MPAPGDRVVVRHLLATGAATDVIGTLVDDGDPLIVERDGERHRIDRAAVVAFKSVPPRPIRASEIRSLDLARARGWISVEHEWIDGWLCRAAPGYAGNRANSAAPLHPDASLDRLDDVRSWYAERGLPLRLTLSEKVIRGRPALDSYNDVLVKPSGGAHDDGVEFADAPSTAWLTLADAPAALVTAAEGEVRFASLELSGAIAATGRLTITADAAGGLWAGIGSIVVDQRFRRRGLATRIMNALATEATALGADRMFLEVMQHNTGARDLYAGLGFTLHHTYGYWIEPA